MPQVVYTDSKGLVQQAGSGFSITTDGTVSISSSLPPVLGSGIALTLQTVAAAGADQDGAAVMSATAGSLVKVTGADNAKGVKLPLLTSCSVGQQFIIYNSAAAGAGNTLKVYPGVGDAFNDTDNNAVVIAGKTSLICIKIDNTTWLAFEPPIATA